MEPELLVRVREGPPELCHLGVSTRRMEQQRTVAKFIETHELRAHPAYRTLDLAAEVGEIAAAIAGSTTYGTEEGAVAVPEDEVGDAFFALLALADGLDIDVDAALNTALAKYERRIETTGEPGSESGTE